MLHFRWYSYFGHHNFIIFITIATFIDISSNTINLNIENLFINSSFLILII